jgi:hypothetical protein
MVEPTRAPAEAAVDEQREQSVTLKQLEDKYGSLDQAWNDAGWGHQGGHGRL